MDDKKPMTSPIRWLFNASLMVLGTVIALRMAVCYIQPIWPWIVGTVVSCAVIWVAITIVRWRRTRW